MDKHDKLVDDLNFTENIIKEIFDVNQQDLYDLLEEVDLNHRDEGLNSLDNEVIEEESKDDQIVEMSSSDNNEDEKFDVQSLIMDVGKDKKA